MCVGKWLNIALQKYFSLRMYVRVTFVVYFQVQTVKHVQIAVHNECDRFRQIKLFGQFRIAEIRINKECSISLARGKRVFAFD